MNAEVIRAKDKLVIETKTYMNRKYLDIRVFYMDDNSGTYKPTKKGITLNNTKDIKELLKVMSDNLGEIETFLGDKKEDNIAN